MKWKFNGARFELIEKYFDKYKNKIWIEEKKKKKKKKKKLTSRSKIFQ